MKHTLIQSIATAFLIVVSSAALASAPTPDEIAAKVLQQGFVDPTQYAKPERMEDHKKALEWMQSLAEKGSLTALADSFAKKVPASVKLHSKKMSVEIGAGLLKASPHALSLATYGEVLNSCGRTGVAGICDIRQFKNLGLGNDFRRYNQDIVFLSAAYVNLLQKGQLNPGPMAGLNNNNNLAQNLVAPPAQITPAGAVEPAEEVDVMAGLMAVQYNKELRDYVNADGYKPIPMDDGSVLFHDLQKDVYLMFDPEQNLYYEL